MRQLDLNVVANEFEAISFDTQLFYNIETGEFEFSCDFMETDEADEDKFEDDAWIAAPTHEEIDEYDIMVDFACSVSDPHKNELLRVALEGRGAFRRFKDTLYRVDLEKEWYAFKHQAYVEIAREWCEENDIAYLDNEKKHKQKPSRQPENDHSERIIIIPLCSKITDDAAEVMCEALNYNKKTAEEEIKRMLKSTRIGFVAITDNCVVGIIGATPQYGVTGWEMHPLAVLKEYQRRGIGTALVEALEYEAATRGGVMIYLGSDDKTGATSLFGVDLYNDTFGKITNIQNTGGHPFSFYEKLGYKIVGVFPDANGVGKPDIWMAKRIK